MMVLIYKHPNDHEQPEERANSDHNLIVSGDLVIVLKITVIPGIYRQCRVIHNHDRPESQHAQQTKRVWQPGAKVQHEECDRQIADGQVIVGFNAGNRSLNLFEAAISPYRREQRACRRHDLAARVMLFDGSPVLVEPVDLVKRECAYAHQHQLLVRGRKVLFYAISVFGCAGCIIMRDLSVLLDLMFRRSRRAFAS